MDSVTITAAPALSDRERRHISSSHRPIRWRFPDDGEPYQLDAPHCAACFEEWGQDGCPTARALTRLAVIEASERQAREAEEKMRRALNKIACRGDIYRPEGRRVLQISMAIAEEAIRAGGVKVIDYTLQDIREQYADWLRKATETHTEKFAKAFCETMADIERDKRVLPDPR